MWVGISKLSVFELKVIGSDTTNEVKLSVSGIVVSTIPHTATSKPVSERACLLLAKIDTTALAAIEYQLDWASSCVFVEQLKNPIIIPLFAALSQKARELGCVNSDV